MAGLLFLVATDCSKCLVPAGRRTPAAATVDCRTGRGRCRAVLREKWRKTCEACERCSQPANAGGRGSPAWTCGPSRRRLSPGRPPRCRWASSRGRTCPRRSPGPCSSWLPRWSAWPRCQRYAAPLVTVPTVQTPVRCQGSLAGRGGRRTSAPAGSGSVTVTPVASFGPSLLSVRRNVSCWPTLTRPARPASWPAAGRPRTGRIDGSDAAVVARVVVRGRIGIGHARSGDLGNVYRPRRWY